jgi:hypothetical protein
LSFSAVELVEKSQRALGPASHGSSLEANPRVAVGQCDGRELVNGTSIEKADMKSAQTFENPR